MTPSLASGKCRWCKYHRPAAKWHYCIRCIRGVQSILQMLDRARDSRTPHANAERARFHREVVEAVSKLESLGGGTSYCLHVSSASQTDAEKITTAPYYFDQDNLIAANPLRGNLDLQIEEDIPRGVWFLSEVG